jgi:hypothetical protein
MFQFIQDPQFSFQITFAAGAVHLVDDLTARIEAECMAAVFAGWTGQHAVRFFWLRATITAWYFHCASTVNLLSVERDEIACI